MSASIETLPTRWRSALDEAAAALTMSSRCGKTSGLPPAEVARRARGLVVERDAVARLLDQLAHEEHIRFRRSLTAPPPTNRALGLPRGVSACLFDLDGVLTGSAAVHAAAWRDVFDGFIRERSEQSGHRFTVGFFDLGRDYYALIHGRPRLDGIRAFLASRGLHLPEGSESDGPEAHTVHGLANRKQALFERRLARDPMVVVGGAGSYLEMVREAGLARAVLSPSANTSAILERAGLAQLIQVCVDGRVIQREGLDWKPAPDAVLYACRQLQVPPEQVAVFETLPIGIEAARATHAGYVVGLDRHGTRTLSRAGADVVVADLAELLDPAFAG